MPRPEWSFEVKDSPTFAEPDYRKLPPFFQVKGSPDEPWWCRFAGSGFIIKKLPVYNRGRIIEGTGDVFYEHDPATRCGNCGSENTLCIYLDNCMDQSGSDCDVEIECYNCGKYTVYKGFS